MTAPGEYFVVRRERESVVLCETVDPEYWQVIGRFPSAARARDYAEAENDLLAEPEVPAALPAPEETDIEYPEDRSGTAREAPSTQGERQGAGVQPAGPHHEDGAGHADDAAPVDGTGNPAPENSESRERSANPLEATPEPLSTSDGETAAPEPDDFKPQLEIVYDAIAELCREGRHDATNKEIAERAGLWTDIVSAKITLLVQEGRVIREGKLKARKLYLPGQDGAPETEPEEEPEPEPEEGDTYFRKCLNCRGEFSTDSPHIRLCSACKASSLFRGGY